MLFVDRSRIVLGWECPRARWWGFEWDSTGVVPAKRPLYFDIGDLFHQGRERLLKGEEIEGVVEALMPDFFSLLLDGGMVEWKVREQVCLVEGMLRAWNRRTLPRLLEEYKVVGVESEFTFPLSVEVTMGVKPDSLLERLSDGSLWYYECKTTSSVGKGWAEQWQTAVQLHSTASIVGERMGREVEGIVVEAVYKGYEEKKAGVQKSILCYGYGKTPLFGVPETAASYTWKAGLKAVAVWEMEGGVRGWVDAMPADILDDLFVQTPPIFLRKELVGAFFRQTVLREVEIRAARNTLSSGYVPEEVKGALMDRAFPQHFSRCNPAIGSVCGFRELCFLGRSGENPLATGTYTRRIPHHSTEETIEQGP